MKPKTKERPAAGAGWRVLFASEHLWPRATQAGFSQRVTRTFIAMLVLLFSLHGFCAEMSQGFLFRGAWYEISIQRDVLTNGPSWNPSSQSNPPLSAAKALEKAKTFIADVKKDKGCRFDLDRLSLRELRSFWIWEAEWSYLRDTEAYQMEAEKMRCWILMDGKVIKPVRATKPASGAEASRQDAKTPR